jgi:SprT protein
MLEKYIPATAIPYCLQLWETNPFELKIRKKRISKVGDFTCRQGKNPRITINQDSHPYLFLLTYVHEVAHLVVHQKYGWKVEAHGLEWKASFRQLMIPVMALNVFPTLLHQALERHLIDPKASSFSDTELTTALRESDQRARHVVLLSQIPEGSTFCFHGRWFKKGIQKRTRVVCRELKSRRNYLVPADAEIEAGSQPLLF